MRFAYKVYDLLTGKVLGTGRLDNVRDSEEGVTCAQRAWQSHHPTRKLHVQEIDTATYASWRYE